LRSIRIDNFFLRSYVLEEDLLRELQVPSEEITEEIWDE
jgi:hypothetical protein